MSEPSIPGTFVWLDIFGPILGAKYKMTVYLGRYITVSRERSCWGESEGE
jgi:hypothetical protein